MKVGFNFLECGMGNNGGTRTILKSGQELENLGCTVEYVATIDNFTWFTHKRPIETIPTDLDVLVATACTTVKSTLQSDAKLSDAFFTEVGKENYRKYYKSYCRVKSDPMFNQLVEMIPLVELERMESCLSRYFEE